MSISYRKRAADVAAMLANNSPQPPVVRAAPRHHVAEPDRPAPRSLPDRILLDIERPVARLQFACAGIRYPQLAGPSGEIAEGLCLGSQLLRINGQIENLN